VHSETEDTGLFFCFTSQFKKGWLREASSYKALDVVGFKDNALNFGIKLGNGDNYDFRGAVADHRLEGQLAISNPNKNPVAALEWKGTKVNVISDVDAFSNRQMVHEGAEEQVGMEITVFQRSGETPTGFAVFFESYWGEETDVPLALIDVHKESKILTFQLHTTSQNVQYKLSPKSASAVLTRLDQQGPNGSVTLHRSRLRLPIRAGGPPFLHKLLIAPM
jgi:hypothetical protein